MLHQKVDTRFSAVGGRNRNLFGSLFQDFSYLLPRPFLWLGVPELSCRHFSKLLDADAFDDLDRSPESTAGRAMAQPQGEV